MLNRLFRDIRGNFKGSTRYGVCVAVYAFLTAFDFVAIVPGISVGRIACFLLIGISLFKVHEMKVPRQRFMIWPFAFFFFAFVSLLFMDFPQNGINGLLSYILVVFVLVAIASIPLSKKDIDLAASGLILAAMVLCLLMVVSPNAVGTEWVTERSVVNLAGSQQDPNQFCGYFLFSIGALTFASLKRGNPLLLLGVAFCFYSILLTGSRGGLIAGLLACVVSVYFGLKESKHRLAYVAIVSIACVVIVVNIDQILSFLPPSVALRFKGLSTSSGAGSMRFDAWEDVMSAYWDSNIVYQLFGHGFGSTTAVTFNGLVAHNTFIEVLYSFGLFGFVSFSALCVSALVAACKSGRYPLVAALAGYYLLIMSITDSSSKMLWLLIALSFAEVVLTRRKGYKKVRVLNGRKHE